MHAKQLVYTVAFRCTVPQTERSLFGYRYVRCVLSTVASFTLAQGTHAAKVYVASPPQILSVELAGAVFVQQCSEAKQVQ